MGAYDIDSEVVQETLTYSAIDLPDWLSVSETGLITGTPLNDDVGAHMTDDSNEQRY